MRNLHGWEFACSMDGAGNVYLCTKEVLVHFKNRTLDMLQETI